MRIIAPKTGKELEEAIKEIEDGTTIWGGLQPTLEQIAAYEEKEKATQGKIFSQSEMKGCYETDMVVKSKERK
jgi:hypothetical protein